MNTPYKLAILAISTALAAELVTASAPHDSIDLSFGETVIPVGTGPGHVVVADVNHDGMPNIIVARG